MAVQCWETVSSILAVMLIATGCFPSFDGLSDSPGSDDATSGLDTSTPTDGVVDAARDSGKIDSSDVLAADVRDLDADTGMPDADALSPPKLLVWYDFDETTGVVVADSSGNERHGSLQGTGNWVSGRLGNALQLDGTTAYVTMPVGIIGQRSELTFAMWIRLDALAMWQRIFDFGKDANTYMFMTSTDPLGKVRFAISVAGIGGEARIASSSSLPVGQWKHIALVLTSTSAAVYIDGVSETRAGTLTPSPSELGLTQNDWLGRSQFVLDSYLKGTIDDFRIYDGALSDAAIFALAHPGN